MRRHLRSFLRRFLKSSNGATAVEFALVATPFLFMLFAIFEIGRLYTISSVLEDATMDAAREVRIGALQTSGGGIEAFQEKVCERMGVFSLGCADALSIDVRVMPSFANQSPPDPVTGDEFNEGVLQFQPGHSQDIILVRTWWRTPFFAPMMTQGLRRLADGSAVLTTATTFRNEPYE